MCLRMSVSGEIRNPIIQGDHVGGLHSVLRKHPKAIVYLPISFPKSFKDEVKSYGAKVIKVHRPLKICGIV